jgi:anti-sigma-K factor RskA
VQHATDDQLVRRALGEPLAELDRHARTCPACAGELAALSDTVRVARAEGASELPPAPEAVWQRISDELGLADLPPVVPAASRRARVRHGGWWAAVGAAAAAVVAVGLVGTVLPDRGQDPSSAVIATELAPVPGSGPVAPAATGSVRLAAAEQELVVDTRGLPAPDGYYQVWLLDPDAGRMVALGVLDDDGTARLPLPEGVAVSDYPTVDVSVEPDDGDPAHSGVSALRAPAPVSS